MEGSMKQQSIEPIVNAINSQNNPVTAFVISVASALLVASIFYIIKEVNKED